MAMTHAVIGVDVGGTNTDAVILDNTGQTINIISKSKTFTTTDVTTGVNVAIHQALINSRKEKRTLAVQQVHIGTTHFINAIVEGKRLSNVSVIRLCGTASKKLPPFSDFPDHLAPIVKGSVFLVNGGYQFDGREIDPIDEDEIVECVRKLKKAGEKNIVISGIFSPVRQEQEEKVLEIIQEVYPSASVTASHEIGKLGLLERENASILNESIKHLCRETITGLRQSLSELGLYCPIFLTQNDGTIIDEEMALKFPVLTFASGMTNSMRGAAFLSKVDNAIVVDIGGTSTDVGVLLNGFPRESSSEVNVGGVRTNFRMPDVMSIGLGGGSYVEEKTNHEGTTIVSVGPRSAGYNIKNEALIFSTSPDDAKSRTVTATDIAIASNMAELESTDKMYTSHLERTFLDKAVSTIHDKVSGCIDQMRFNDRDLPLILVGGGSILINTKYKFDGISEIITPENFDVANAVGAALSKVSAIVDKVVDLSKYVEHTTIDTAEQQDYRKRQLEKARTSAIDDIISEAKSHVMAAGGLKDSLVVVEKDDVALSYIPGDATRVKVKVVGDLSAKSSKDIAPVEDSTYLKRPTEGGVSVKQSVASTGKLLFSGKDSIVPQEPKIDFVTGEWLVSEYDIECISIGAGILGCGGGGSPYLGKIQALRMVTENKVIRVCEPSRFLKDAHPENDLVSLVAFMGAPLILYEKLVSGKETIDALECIKDLHRIGQYADGDLLMKETVQVEEKGGVRYIDDYKVSNASSPIKSNNEKVVAIMCAEVGGMNSFEPLLVGGTLGMPVLDCDGMGRAFPELQMFCPFMYDCVPYPCTLADDKGRRAVVLKAENPKQLEDHFRSVVISMGCSGGVVLSHFNKEDILKKTVHHSLSHARKIGDTIIRARVSNRSPIQDLLDSEHGKRLVYGKISDLKREITGGFTKGTITVEGLDEHKKDIVSIEFQNEFLIAKEWSSGQVLACVPDLISLLDPDTAQPVPSEEIRFGIRVVVVAFRAHPLLTTDKALRIVGPHAFGYPEDIKYRPINENYSDTEPIPPK